VFIQISDRVIVNTDQLVSAEFIPAHPASDCGDDAHNVVPETEARLNIITTKTTDAVVPRFYGLVGRDAERVWELLVKAAQSDKDRLQFGDPRNA
jgi:hypothetical protein